VLRHRRQFVGRTQAQLITALEDDQADEILVQAVRAQAATQKITLMGITGTGGALLGDRICINAINPWNSQTPTLVASCAALPPGS